MARTIFGVRPMNIKREKELMEIFRRIIDYGLSVYKRASELGCKKDEL